MKSEIEEISAVTPCLQGKWVWTTILSHTFSWFEYNRFYYYYCARCEKIHVVTIKSSIETYFVRKTHLAWYCVSFIPVSLHFIQFSFKWKNIDCLYKLINLCDEHLKVHANCTYSFSGCIRCKYACVCVCTDKQMSHYTHIIIIMLYYFMCYSMWWHYVF